MPLQPTYMACIGTGGASWHASSGHGTTSAQCTVRGVGQTNFVNPSLLRHYSLLKCGEVSLLEVMPSEWQLGTWTSMSNGWGQLALGRGCSGVDRC